MFLRSQGRPCARQGQLRQEPNLQAITKPGPGCGGDPSTASSPFSPKPGPPALCVHVHRISSTRTLRDVCGPAVGTQPTLDMKTASWDLFPKRAMS